MLEIIPLIKKVKFFKEKESSDEYFLDLIKKLRYEFIPKGDIIFERGNIKSCLILIKTIYY